MNLSQLFTHDVMQKVAEKLAAPNFPGAIKRLIKPGEISWMKNLGSDAARIMESHAVPGTHPVKPLAEFTEAVSQHMPLQPPAQPAKLMPFKDVQMANRAQQSAAQQASEAEQLRARTRAKIQNNPGIYRTPEGKLQNQVGSSNLRDELASTKDMSDAEFIAWVKSRKPNSLGAGALIDDARKAASFKLASIEEELIEKGRANILRQLESCGASCFTQNAPLQQEEARKLIDELLSLPPDQFATAFNQKRPKIAGKIVKFPTTGIKDPVLKLKSLLNDGIEIPKPHLNLQLKPVDPPKIETLKQTQEKIRAAMKPDLLDRLLDSAANSRPVTAISDLLDKLFRR